MKIKCIIRSGVTGRVGFCAAAARIFTAPADKEDLINMIDKTMTFSVHDDRENEMKEILTTVYDALKQKGYNPINQLVGYILSEDPTYITTFNNARGLIRHIDRDELLQVLVKSYLAD